MRTLCLCFTAACALDGLPVDAAPMVPTFEQTALIPTTFVEFTVTGATPGDFVYVAGSFRGLGSGPCIPSVGVCLDLQGPVFLIGSSVVNAGGIGTVAVRVPASAPQRFLYTQAVVRGPTASVTTQTIVAPILGGFLDNDGDGFCGGARCQVPTDQPGDCNDDDSLAFPGQAAFFELPHELADGTLSYDWDCDGTESPELPDLFQCVRSQLLITCSSWSEGWLDNAGGPGTDVPACGDTDSYGSTGCLGNPAGIPGLLPLCVAVAQDDTVQRCR